MTDEQLAAISELCRRYFTGWAPKTVGKRRHPLFEEKIRKIVEENDWSFLNATERANHEASREMPTIPVDERFMRVVAERDELRARVAKLEEQLAFFMNEVGERRLEEILRTNSDTTPDLAAKVAVLEERVLRLERVAVGVRRSPQLRSDILRDLQSREDWGK